MILTVGINDSNQVISAFMQSHNYNVPVLLDSASSAALDYGVSAIPTTFFINRTGIIQYIQRGAFQTQTELQNALDKIK